MASFIGTFDEFIKYINPRIKNVVNSISRAYKQTIGQCEHCGINDAVLEAAHVTGRERPVIIGEVLQDYMNGQTITVDLDVFEHRFKRAHEPISDCILVLCRPCHTKYDSKVDELVQTNNSLANFVTESVADELLPITNSEITDFLRRIVPILPCAEIENLLSSEYCNQKFNVHFPVLKEVPVGSNVEVIRNYARVNGYNRWSTRFPIQVEGRLFLVLTQWYEANRVPFLLWKSEVLKIAETA
jgi:hypothetical protein